MLTDHPPPTERRVAERDAVDADTFAREIIRGYRPVVLRGQVARWRAVAAGQGGDRAMAEYLAAFGGAKPLEVLIGAPEIEGRFFYADDTLTAFNFHRQQVPIGALVAELLRYAEAGRTAARALRQCGDRARASAGWEEANPLGLGVDAPARLWIGNATRVATHYDTSINIAWRGRGAAAVHAVPARSDRHLYIGPLDHTMAGPPSSMVDPDAPDLARYPRFADALVHAEVADLEPGDAVFIPPIWWHHVRAFDPFNVLVNYWWEHRSSARVRRSGARDRCGARPARGGEGGMAQLVRPSRLLARCRAGGGPSARGGTRDNGISQHVGERRRSGSSWSGCWGGGRLIRDAPFGLLPFFGTYFVGPGDDRGRGERKPTTYRVTGVSRYVATHSSGAFQLIAASFSA